MGSKLILVNLFHQRRTVICRERLHTLIIEVSSHLLAKSTFMHPRSVSYCTAVKHSNNNVSIKI